MRGINKFAKFYSITNAILFVAKGISWQKAT